MQLAATFGQKPSGNFFQRVVAVDQNAEDNSVAVKVRRVENFGVNETEGEPARHFAFGVVAGGIHKVVEVRGVEFVAN